MLRFACLALAAATVLVGCDDPSTQSPTGPAQQTPTVRRVIGANRMVIQTLDDVFAKVAAIEPTFAGIVIDAGRPTVLLTDPTRPTSVVRSAIQTVFRDPRFDGPLTVRRADYGFAELYAWSARLPQVMANVPGVNMLDIDEQRNRLVVGIDDDAVRSAVEAELERFNIPRASTIIEVRPQAVAMSQTLQDVIRQIVAGVKIDFDLGSCSLGFNTSYGGVAAYATAGHCSDTWGGTGDNTAHYQNDATKSADLFGHEALESQSFNIFTDSRCPSFSNNCRWSDFALGYYTAGYVTQQAMGHIARPTTRTRFGTNLVISATNPTISIYNKVLFPLIGDTVDKVGERTGWTHGPVTGTCQTILLTDSLSTPPRSFDFICISAANAGADHGDSGSPVFIYSVAGDTASLAGLLFARSSGTTFIFSPLNNIQGELGLLPATIYGF